MQIGGYLLLDRINLFSTKILCVFFLDFSHEFPGDLESLEQKNTFRSSRYFCAFLGVCAPVLCSRQKMFENPKNQSWRTCSTCLVCMSRKFEPNFWSVISACSRTEFDFPVSVYSPLSTVYSLWVLASASTGTRWRRECTLAQSPIAWKVVRKLKFQKIWQVVGNTLCQRANRRYFRGFHYLSSTGNFQICKILWSIGENISITIVV